MAQTTRPVPQAALIEHGGGFDHLQRFHRLAKTFSIGDPGFGLVRAGHPLHFINRVLIATLFQRPARAFQPPFRFWRWGAFTPEHEQLAQLALERGP
ncbi:MAG: hypothetical protein U0995_04570 [Erythrobacter sp.]|nr:hypothetical protein [Erythrobacter sp.]